MRTCLSKRVRVLLALAAACVVLASCIPLDNDGDPGGGRSLTIENRTDQTLTLVAGQADTDVITLLQQSITMNPLQPGESAVRTLTGPDADGQYCQSGLFYILALNRAVPARFDSATLGPADYEVIELAPSGKCSGTSHIARRHVAHRIATVFRPATF